MKASRIYKLSDFVSVSQESAGRSPSQVMSLKIDDDEIVVQENRVQVKASNGSRFTRKMIGYDPDSSDLLGEYIASIAAYSSLNPTLEADQPQNSQQAMIAPKVALINDEKGGRVLMGSEYLNYGSDQIATMSITDSIRHQIKHDNPDAKFTKNEHRKYQINCAEDAAKVSNGLTLSSDIFNAKGDKVASGIDKKSLYDGLAFSLVMGDHDLSTGNFMLIAANPEEPAKVGRIDFGHAFNDLIKNWQKDHRPRYTTDSPIMDALNRDTVNGGDINKFKRTFSGIIPDVDFASALDGMAKHQEAIKQSFKQSISEINQFCKDNPSQNEEVKKSVITLMHRIGCSDQDIHQLRTHTVETSLWHLEHHLDNFADKMIGDAKYVGDIIKVQSLVDQSLQSSNKRSEQDIAAEIKDICSKNPKLAANPNMEIEWVKTDLDKKPFKGTISEYIEDRAAKLDIHEGLVETKNVSFFQKFINAIREIFNMQEKGQSEEKDSLIHTNIESDLRAHKASGLIQSIENEKSNPEIAHNVKSQQNTGLAQDLHMGDKEIKELVDKSVNILKDGARISQLDSVVEKIDDPDQKKDRGGGSRGI